MSLLDTVKSLLGLEDTAAQPGRQEDVAVTVEHEPTADTPPDTESEDAVKGTETASQPDSKTTVSYSPAASESASPSEASDPDPSSPDAESNALDDEPTTDDQTPSAADTDASKTESVTDATDTDADEAPTDAETEPSDSDPEPSEADVVPESGESGEPLDVIKGIGPTYADQLDEAGIETVDHLAGAEADDLVELTDISEKRLTRWIERAKLR